MNVSGESSLPSPLPVLGYGRRFRRDLEDGNSSQQQRRESKLSSRMIQAGFQMQHSLDWINGKRFSLMRFANQRRERMEEEERREDQDLLHSLLRENRRRRRRMQQTRRIWWEGGWWWKKRKIHWSRIEEFASFYSIWWCNLSLTWRARTASLFPSFSPSDHPIFWSWKQ